MEDILVFNKRDGVYRSCSILYPKAGGTIVHVKHENYCLREGIKVFTWNKRSVDLKISDTFQVLSQLFFKVYMKHGYNITQMLHKRGRSEFFVKEHDFLTAFYFGVLFASKAVLTSKLAGQS